MSGVVFLQQNNLYLYCPLGFIDDLVTGVFEDVEDIAS